MWRDFPERCEVVFTEWTGEGKIRHPSFQGLRAEVATTERAPMQYPMQPMPVERAAGRLPVADLEEVVLDLAAHATRRSRLACQIILTDEMKTLDVRIPPAARNWLRG